jgi:hypothetical protein
MDPPGGGNHPGAWASTETPGVQNGKQKNSKKVSFSVPETCPKDPVHTPQLEASSSWQELKKENFIFLKSPQAYHPSTVKNRRALDLFSGTGAVGRHLAKLGFEVTTLDWDKNFNPDICVNILDWDYKQYPPRYFRLISAGVPCTEYSRAKTVGDRKILEADAIALRTLEILEYFRPEIWWIENPRTGLLKSRKFMEGLSYINVDYCQFSDWGYQKPTRIWGCRELCEIGDWVCDHISFQIWRKHGMGESGIGNSLGGTI